MHLNKSIGYSYCQAVLTLNAILMAISNFKI